MTLWANWTYTWWLTNAQNATISGPSNTPTVTVVSDACGAAFTLHVQLYDPNTGCTITCFSSFSFADTLAPYISAAGPNYNLPYCTATPVFTPPNALDGCLGPVTPVITSNTVQIFADGSRIYTRVWTATDACGNTSAPVTQIIHAPPCCESQVLTGGQCKKCDAKVTVLFDPNFLSCVSVTSCKKLGNVVLRDCEGTDYKFDNLSAFSGYFCHPSGLPISTVWVKSGCYLSGDGPGYGRRFDSPCRPCGEEEPRTQETVVPDDEETGEAYAFFPNPFSRYFTIGYTLEETDRAEVVVTDMLGRVVYRRILDSQQISHIVDLAASPAGMYLVQVIVNNEIRQVSRMIKQGNE